MKLGQALKMAFKSILGNKGRSVLTMLGIIIGIASVMTIVSTVNGMNEISKKQFESMGTNRVNVSCYINNGRPVFKDLYNYCKSLGSDLVLGITPNAQFNCNVVYGSRSSSSWENNYEQIWNSEGENTDVALPPNMYFGSDQFAICNKFDLAKGRDISMIDVENYSQVCVLGARAAKNFFASANPVGQTLRVAGYPYTIIGVYREKDPDSSYSQDNVIVFPYTANRLLQPGMDMNDFTVKAASAEATTEVVSYLSSFLASMTNNGENGFGYAYSDNQWQQSENDYLNMISLVLGGIAAISLLVGGIGIMNIMLVTVTERTREIGIRRAIGAQRSAIVSQFLIEAAMLCGIGGLIGIGLGTIGTRIAGKLMLHADIWPALWITGFAFALSVLLGVLFGSYPAVKASRL